MNKFRKKGIILVLIAISIHFILNNLIDTTKIRDKERTTTFSKFYAKTENTIDLLFLGSSHNYYSLNPEVFNQKLGVSSFGLGSDSQSFASSYYMLKESLKSQKPKIVIQEVYYATYPSNLNEIRFGIENMGDFNLKSTEIYNDLSFKDKLQYGIKYMNLDLKISNILRNETGIEKSTKNIDGFKVNNKTISKKFFTEITKKEKIKAELTSEFYSNMRYFDKIIELCEKNGIKIIFISTPMIILPSNYNEIQHYLKQYFIERKYQLYDFSNDQIIEFIPTEDFSDFTHLNTIGAEKISSYLSDYIKNENLLETNNYE